MLPFTLRVGEANEIDIDGVTYRVKIVSQGWVIEGRTLTITLIVKHPPIKKLEKQYEEDQ